MVVAQDPTGGGDTGNRSVIGQYWRGLDHGEYYGSGSVTTQEGRDRLEKDADFWVTQTTDDPSGYAGSGSITTDYGERRIERDAQYQANRADDWVEENAPDPPDVPDVPYELIVGAVIFVAVAYVLRPVFQIIANVTG